MTGKFHATFKARDENTMELVFDDAPWDGETTLSGVEVQIFERDKSLGSKREPSKDDRLGTVTVDLEQGPPNQYGRPTVAIKTPRFEPIAGASVKSGTFDLVVGPETFRIDVLMEREEWPHDKDPPWAIAQRNFIELGLVVSAPGKPTYSSLEVGIRPDRLTALRGPVLTFIATAAGSGDVMADNAAVHWTPRSDRLVRPDTGIMSLEEIIEKIDDDIGVDLVWKQVNIVTHGNLAGLLLPLRKGDQVKELTHVSVEDIKPRHLGKLDSRASHIVIRGCSIGRDKELLEALSRQFSNCKIFAPNVHLIAYHRFKKGPTERTRELLYRRYWAFRPGPNTQISPRKMAKLLEAQQSTMPLQPKEPFTKIVSKPFDGKSKAIPEFFRRKPDVQKHELTLEGEALRSQLERDASLRDGRGLVAKHLQSSKGAADRAALTQPDHVPLSDNDPLWGDLEAWQEQKHWAVNGVNLEDEVVNPADPDPRHRIRARVTLTRVKVEACELEDEITDADVRNHPGFGSS